MIPRPADRAAVVGLSSKGYPSNIAVSSGEAELNALAKTTSEGVGVVELYRQCVQRDGAPDRVCETYYLSAKQLWV